MADGVILDASVMVELLVGTSLPNGVDRLKNNEIHVPAHFDAEVLSALGRLERSGDIAEKQVERCLRDAANAPFQRHSVAPLMAPAWALRHNFRLADALYVALASELGFHILTLDSGLAAASDLAELISDA